MFFGVRTGGRWFLGMVISGATRGAIGFATALWAIAFSTNSALAQITPDKTLPNNSTVRLDGNTHIIEGGTRAGGNLFHSFQEFSVPTGSTAFFNNAADIQNIFGRVTGGAVSNIDGLIRANGTANLFLINPNGIIFGKNANLNIGGSLVATTASAIQFGNQGFFSATTPNAPPLLTVNPSAFLFNQIPSGNILFQAGRQDEISQVAAGRSLLLLGGNISVDGTTLDAQGGRVELGGLAGVGTVGLNFDNNNLSLAFPTQVERANISLTNRALVNVNAGGGGSIAINAQNLAVLGGSTLRAGASQSFGSFSTQLGDITIDATGAISVDDGSTISSSVEPGAVSNSGKINIQAGSLSITNNSALFATTFGRGDTTNISIRVNGPVALANNSQLFSSVESGGVGLGSDIDLQAASLVLKEGSLIGAGTFGRGNSANVNINVRDTVSLDGVGSDGSPSGVFSTVGSRGIGNGGNIFFAIGGSLSVTNGAQVSTSTFGQGNAGNLNVNVRNSVYLSGTSADGKFASGLQSAVELEGVGKGGNLNLNTGRLVVRDGAQVSTATFGQGNAGNITFNTAESVELTGTSANGKFASGFTSAVEQGSEGRGGDLNFATNRLVVRDGAEVTVRNQGRGNAGNLNVKAQSVSLDNQGKLTANSVTGEGGNINLSVQDLLLMRRNSVITNTSGTAQAGGNGGNFTLNTRFIVAPTFENSDIITNAFNGRGGNIDINAFRIFGFVIRSREDLEKLRPNDLDPRQLPTNDISAVSQTGPSFVILNQEDFSRVLVLPTRVDVSNRLITASCTAFDEKGGSSFTVTGRGGLPPSPDELLTNDVVWTDTRLPATTTQQHSSKKPSAKLPSKSKAKLVVIVPATGWVFNGKGEVTLISSAPNATGLGTTPATCPRR